MICVCDIGTSSLKAGIISHDGTLRAFERIPLNTFSTGFRASEWATAFFKATDTFPRELMKSVEAVAISGHGPTLVPLNRNEKAGAPLFWFSFPVTPEKNRFISYFLPQILEYRERSGEKFTGTSVFLPCPEYLCFVLTGEKAAKVPHEGFHRYFWSNEECSREGLDCSLLPPLSQCTEAVGTLNRAGMDGLGIARPIPVYSAGPDFLAAALGTNCLSPGKVHIRGGTSESVNALFADVDPGIDSLRNRQFRIIPGFSGNTMNVSRFLSGVGRVLQLLSAAGLGPVDRLCCEALTAAPGSRGLVFTMPNTVLNLLPEKIDLAGSFSGGPLSPAPQEYVRAFLEYAAGKIAGVCRDLADAGFDVTELVVSGGLSKCFAYNIFKASAAGIPVTVPRIHDAELLGNAAIAMTGLGLHDTPETAAKEMFSVQQIIEPDPLLQRYFQSGKTD